MAEVAHLITPGTDELGLIIQAIRAENGRYFQVDDVEAYVQKVMAHGRILASVPGSGGDPTGFILYYDNLESAFISMTWTDPSRRGSGVMTRLLASLVRGVHKDIRLDVHEENTARRLYESFGFYETGTQGPLVSMVRPRRVAIMQPYWFPYLGYFQLIEAAERFVFYDDVNYIPRGWVNRNRILGSDGPLTITVPVASSSQNSLIKDVQVALDERTRTKIKASLTFNYAKSPYRADVVDLVMGVLSQRGPRSIADVAIESVTRTYEYLGLTREFVRSSDLAPNFAGSGKAERLAAITRGLGFDAYVNPSGGRDIYDKASFEALGVRLDFSDALLPEYTQGQRSSFAPGLSIIDVLMWNDAQSVRGMIGRSRLS